MLPLLLQPVRMDLRPRSQLVLLTEEMLPGQAQQLVAVQMDLRPCVQQALLVEEMLLEQARQLAAVRMDLRPCVQQVLLAEQMLLEQERQLAAAPSPNCRRNRLTHHRNCRRMKRPRYSAFGSGMLAAGSERSRPVQELVQKPLLRCCRCLLLQKALRPDLVAAGPEQSGRVPLDLN